jgi:hypothetical protein
MNHVNGFSTQRASKFQSALGLLTEEEQQVVLEQAREQEEEAEWTRALEAARRRPERPNRRSPPPPPRAAFGQPRQPQHGPERANDCATAAPQDHEPRKPLSVWPQVDFIELPPQLPGEYPSLGACTLAPNGTIVALRTKRRFAPASDEGKARKALTEALRRHIESAAAPARPESPARPAPALGTEA